jgi:glycosyltransferase involved in cell wall biosynthesis/GT2 family glycosyltransferase
MRIVMANKYAYITGGADRQCLALAKALREQGHEVAFLSSTSPENLEDRGIFIPASVTHATRDALPPSQQAETAVRAFWNRDAALAMKRLLREFRPDIVHAHKLYPQLSVAPILVAHRRGVPIVQTLHDYEFMAANPLDATGARFDRRELRISYRTLNTATFLVRRRTHVSVVDEWIAVSDFVAKTYERHGIRSTVIPNFADMDVTSAPRPWPDRTGIAFLGALTEEKGVLDVLRLARELGDVQVIVGGRGYLEPLVAREAAQLPNVDFRGLLDPTDATELIRSSRIVVVPSRWQEPGGLVALEAMAAGTPIVAYRRGGLQEYVSVSGGGLVVDPSPQALVTACRSLLGDEDLWERCSSSGVEAAKTHFSRAEHTAAVLEVYRRAMRKTGFAPAAIERIEAQGRKTELRSSGVRVSILIPTHMDADLLKKSLPVFLDSQRPDVEVIVLNNDPTQDVRAILGPLADDSRVRIVEMHFEAGFSRAINRGIQESTGEVVMFCNADLFPSPTYLDEMLKFFDANPRTGAAVGKLLRYDLAADRPTEVIDSAGLFLTRQRRLMPRGEGARDTGQFDDATEVFAVDGAAIVLRRSALDEISVQGEYLDENFVMHKEDHDVSWRLRLAGWECWYVPQALAYHGRTTRGLGTKKYLSAIRDFHRNEQEKALPVRIHAMKNQWLMLLKNEDPHNFVRDFPFILGREALVVTHNVFTAPRTLVAVPLTMRVLPETLKKRRIAKTTQTMDPHGLRRWISVSP